MACTRAYLRSFKIMGDQWHIVIMCLSVCVSSCLSCSGLLPNVTIQNRASAPRSYVGFITSETLRPLWTVAKLNHIKSCQSYHSVANTELFHSIRHPAWRVTSLPKFWFRQAPDLNVTSKYFRQVGCNFCVRSLKIVHCQLNYIYYLHNVCKCDWRASGIFFIFLIYLIEFSGDFGTWLKFALPALHFGNFEGCVTCYCRIEWNSTVI